MRLKEAVERFAQGVRDGMDAGHRTEKVEIWRTEDGLLVVGLDALGSPVVFINLESDAGIEELEDHFQAVVLTIQATRDMIGRYSPPRPSGDLAGK